MKPARSRKLNDQINAEAAEWFVEFRAGDVDAAGRVKFNAWLCTSPEHLQAYLELAGIWNEGPRLDPNRTFGHELIGGPAGDANIIPFSGMPHQQPPMAPTPAFAARTSVGHARRAGRGATLFALAACVVVALVSAWAWSERNTYHTGIGEQRSFALGDGSKIELNAKSRIRVRFTATRRVIDLIEGQAFFWVAKDEARPFIVESEGTQVRAVGTEFDVYRRATGTTVTVLEGAVAVLHTTPAFTASRKTKDIVAAKSVSPHQAATQSRPAPMNIGSAAGSGSTFEEHSGSSESLRPMEGRSHSAASLELASAGESTAADAGEFVLAAGEQAILTAQSTVKPKQPNIAAATAWTQGRLIFESVPLAEVAEEMNRYNQPRLVIQGEQLAALRITGVFASTDATALIRFLQARPGIIVTRRRDEVLITRQIP